MNAATVWAISPAAGEAWSSGRAALSGAQTTVRASSAWVANQTGAYEAFGSNVIPGPRVTGAYLGAAVAGAVRNAADLSQATWSLTGAPTITLLAGTSLGLFARTQIASGGSTGSRRKSAAEIAVTSGTPVTIHFLYEAGTSGRARCTLSNSGETTFSTLAGPVGGLVSVSTTLGTFSNIVDTLQADGVTRYLTATFTPVVTESLRIAAGPDSATAGATLIVCGLDVQAVNAVTPFIFSGATALTRQASVVTAPASGGKPFAGWTAAGLDTGFRATVRINLPAIGTAAERVIAVWGVDADNCVKLVIGADDKAALIVRNGAVDELTLALPDALMTYGQYRYDISVQDGGFRLSDLDGATVTSSATPGLPSFTSLRLGSDFDGTSYLEGYLLDIAVGQNVGWVDNTGATALADLDASEIPADTEWKHIILYGQSLSVGARGQPLESAVQSYGHKTFGSGPRSTTAQMLTSTALVESIDVVPDLGETMCSSICNGVTELQVAEDGQADGTVFFSNAPGEGGLSITALNKGTTPYTRLITGVISAKALATTAGKTYSVPAVCWEQGQEDATDLMPQATYYAHLNQLQADLEADIQAITGQTSPVYLIVGQTNRTRTSDKVALAQLEAMADNPRIIVAGPSYTHNDLNGRLADGTHLTGKGYYIYGKSYARVLKNLLDGKRPLPLRPVTLTASGSTLQVRFDVPYKPLRFNTADVGALATDYGVKITDSSGTLTIRSVRVVNRDTLEYRLNRALTGSVAWRYAVDFSTSGTGLSGGAIGNIADSSPYVAPAPSGNVNAPNFSPHAQLTTTV